MAAFDPDAYLAQKTSAPVAFDPDAYLASKTTPSEIPAARKPPSTLDVATSAPYKSIAGMADVFLTAPQNVANLAKMGFGAAATALGKPELAPEVTAPSALVAGLFQRAGLIKPTEGMTTGQRLLDVALQSATGGAISPARTGLEMAGSALKGGIAGLTGQTVTETTGSPLAGIAASMATPSALTMAAQAKQKAMSAAQLRNQVRDETIRKAQTEGYLVTPGSITPSAQNVLLERLAGKTRTQQLAAVENQVVTDKLARRAAGLPEDTPLTSEAMQAIRKEEFAKGYAPIGAIGIVPVDKSFANKLNDIESKYSGAGKSFPGAIPQPVKNLVDGFKVNQFDSADALEASRALREQAKGSFRTGENALGKAQSDVAKALEDQIERHLTNAGQPAQQILDQFRESRRRMAVSHSIEDAIVEGGGAVNARKLAADLQSGKYLSGDLKTIAAFANVARPVTPVPGTMGTPGSQNFLGYGAGGIAAGLGALAGGPLTAAIGAVAPATTSAAARNYLLSKMGQSRALPTYERPMINMLSTQPSNNLFMSTMTGLPVANQQSAP